MDNMYSVDLEVKSNELDQWLSGPLYILKIIDALEKLLFMQVISTNIYSIRNYKTEKFKKY